MSFSEWKEVKLSDVVDIIGGGTPKTNVEEYWNGNIPWLSVKDFNNSNRYVYSTEKSITELGLLNSSAKLLDKDNLIISARGTVGQIAQLGNRMAFNQSCYGLKGKQGLVINTFLYYMLRYNIKNIKNNTHGSVFDTITRETFNVLGVEIPPLPEQKAIATTLSCLDDKIELNNCINKTLEEIAQAIFKSWFVDFEPFQDGEFEDSELGRIPKGWRVGKIKDIASFQNGYAFYKIGYCDSGVMVIDLGNVDLLGNFIKTKADKFISYELYNQEKMKKFHVCKNDLVMIMTDRKATMDLLGKVAKVSTEECFILNQRVGRIRTDDNINVNFLYTYLNSEFLLNELKKKALGSVQKYVNTSDITDLKLIIPNNDAMHKFGDMINPFFEEMELLKCENEVMNSIRDTLLPKLMSGEIRVPIEEVQ